jgi:hypothetical protein
LEPLLILRIPQLCTTAANPDPNEKNLGGSSTVSYLNFRPAVLFTDLYSAAVIQAEICTDQTLSSSDLTAFRRILRTLGVTNAKGFYASIGVTGGAGVQFPSVVPFSYSYDESQNTYNTETSSSILPWQLTTNDYTLSFSYSANSATSIETAKLVSGIVTSIEGANPSTTIISAATSNYFNVGANIIDQVASEALKDKNVTSAKSPISLVARRQRGAIFRFRDLSGRSLAAVKVSLILTNTVNNPKPVFPTTAAGAVPSFSGYPPVLDLRLGGPLSPTLGQSISTQESYKAIITADGSTSGTAFAHNCDVLEQTLMGTYGLNRYDTALAMGAVLSLDSPYSSFTNLSGSKCFENPALPSKALLKEMGLNI